MIFSEDTINRNAALALCNLKERRSAVRRQISRIREMHAEIDRLDDTCQHISHHHIRALNMEIGRLDVKKRHYKRARRVYQRWQQRAALFQEFKADYEAAGQGGAA